MQLFSLLNLGVTACHSLAGGHPASILRRCLFGFVLQTSLLSERVPTPVTDADSSSSISQESKTR